MIFLIAIAVIITARHFIGLHFKKKEELKKIFFNCGINLDEKLAFTCGSGITACVLGLASTVINNKLPVIYDGSWAEYGLK